MALRFPKDSSPLIFNDFFHIIVTVILKLQHNAFPKMLYQNVGIQNRTEHRVYSTTKCTTSVYIKKAHGKV